MGDLTIPRIGRAELKSARPMRGIFASTVAKVTHGVQGILSLDDQRCRMGLPLEFVQFGNERIR
jgi:hypothetical protein